MPRIEKRPTPASLFKHIAAVVLFLVAAGCSGGGCSSGCSSCGGVTPLVNGFDPSHRIENAGSARVTPSGLGFIQSNLGTLAQGLLGSTSTGGIIDFAVPQTSGSEAGITYSLCPNGSNTTSNPKVCDAEIDIGNAALTLTPASPYDLHITGTLPLRVQEIQAQIDLGVCSPTIDVSLNGDGSCPGGNSYASVPLDVDIAIHVDTDAAHIARVGYSQIIINSVIDDSAIETALEGSLNVCGGQSCTGTLCCIENICGCALGGIADWSPVKNAIVNALVPTLDSTLKSTIAGELCQKATATQPCPAGTTADSSMICRDNNDPNNTCASIIVGTDGHMNLGTLLESLSPGTTGGLDFLFAAGGADKNTNDPSMMLDWGDLDPVNGGATLGLFGGAEPNPLSKCVPMANLTLPSGIPIPDELLGNFDTIPDWPTGIPGPHVEIALNERFTNYALGGLYNSGLLCIGVSTASIPLLSSGTIGLLAPSLKNLGLQQEPQQVAIVIRPSVPPTVVFGNGTDINTDPVMRVDLKQVSLDFYIFSLDRFIRFMTATFDLDVPVNLTVSSAGLTPVISTINVTNGTVTNSQLLLENPTTLAASLGQLIGSEVGQQLGGSLSAINLNSSLASLGLQLYIPDTVTGMGSPGLRKLSKGSDNYLGIFAAFQLPGTMVGPKAPPLRTHVQVTHKTVDPAGLKFETLRPDNQPVVELVAESTLDDGSHTVEYQYRVDDGFWHPYQRSRFLTVKDDWLRVQGRHAIKVRSHAVGEPDSEDEIAGEAEVIIDTTPPRVTLGAITDGKVTVKAHDLVTPDVLVRYRLDKAEWSTWTPASRLEPIRVGEAANLIVEAQDSEGNVGTATQALIRGQYDGAAAACGSCNVGAEREPSGNAGGVFFLVGIALAGIGKRVLRRRGRAAGEAAAPVALAASVARPIRTAGAPGIRGPVAGGRMRRMLGGVAVMVIASSWAGCHCGGSKQSGGTGTGGASCGAGCVELEPGLIGEYSSAVVIGSDIWVAGYSEADWVNDNQYGDLVAGKWDGTKVDWDQVDGVPSTPAVDCTMVDCHGFRGGQTTPGDDVGLWTSIAVGADNNPAIAYFDRTNQALKFAQYNGTTWTVQTVDTVMGGVAGRYAKMLFLNNNFVIAYQTVAPGGMGGALISKVRVATSAGGTPAAASWTFEDAATVNTTPCRASFCAMTEACVSTTKVCTATATTCAPACASGQACVGSPAACAAIWDDTKLDSYPDAIGDYITMAPDGQGGFGLAYYDRTNGNLVIASKASGTWTTMIVDGEGATGPGTGGDAGIGATLFIDTNGDWHLAYVNGYSEAIQYVKVTGGKTPLAPEIIDDGLSLAGTPFSDGQHLVGDDAHLIVLPGGEVHVTYADSTAGTLHYAIGTPGSTGHLWMVASPMQDGFAGAFSSIVVQNGQTQLMNWWRTGAAMTAGDVRFVSPP